jgi:hypothetical protein
LITTNKETKPTKQNKAKIPLSQTGLERLCLYTPI